MSLNIYIHSSNQLHNQSYRQIHHLPKYPCASLPFFMVRASNTRSTFLNFKYITHTADYRGDAAQQVPGPDSSRVTDTLQPPAAQQLLSLLPSPQRLVTTVLVSASMSLTILDFSFK